MEDLTSRIHSTDKKDYRIDLNKLQRMEHKEHGYMEK